MCNSIIFLECEKLISIKIPNGVSNIERNRYQPTAETIDRICKTFKITPAELLLLPTDSNNEIIENIVTLLSTCPTKKLKKIYEMIQLMVK